MTNILNIFKETIRLGQILKNSLPNEIRDAEENGWDSESIGAIRDGVEKYLRLIAFCARAFALFAFIPFIFVIACLTLHLSVGWIYSIAADWALIVGLAAIWLLFPLFSIVPLLRKLPDTLYRELLTPLWSNLELCYLAINAALFVYIYASWELTATLPLWLLLGALWVLAPWIAYLVKQNQLFVALRLTQLALLIAWTLITVASPVPMTHFQSWAEREVANKIRPVEQKDVTEQWASLRWFTQEGKASVWYSSSAGRGYRLFAAPGHDPETNQELKPVSDAATKEEIVGWFNKKRISDEKRLFVETEKRAAEVAALEKQRSSEVAARETQRLAEMAAQQERAKSETKARLVQEYVASRETAHLNGITVVTVLNSLQVEDTALTERVSRTLSEAGFTNSIRVFTPAFFQSQLFRDMVVGATSPEEHLFRADQYAAYLLVIQTAVVPGKQQPVNNEDMFMADLKATVRLIATTTNRTVHILEIKTRGTGFNEADATKMAVQRLNNELIKAVPVFAAKRTN